MSFFKLTDIGILYLNFIENIKYSHGNDCKCIISKKGEFFTTSKICSEKIGIINNQIYYYRDIIDILNNKLEFMIYNNLY